MKRVFMSNNAILCVDDEKIVLQALRSLLTNNLDNIQIVEVAQSAEEALEVLADFEADETVLKAVIVDYVMPGMGGDDLLIEIHNRLPRVKNIMLTGQSNLRGIKRVINEANLYRFIEKPWVNQDILLTVSGAIEAYDNELELEQQYAKLVKWNEELESIVEERTKELEILAVTDQLTRVGNRLMLDQEFEKECCRAKRYNTFFSVILIDIDKFKTVNDEHGHQVGDKTLKEFANIIKNSCRKTDLIGRWGGEEFLILCPHTGLDGAVNLANNIKCKIENNNFEIVGKKTASFGVATYTDGDEVRTIMERADAALYCAKDKGRNRVEVM